MSELRPELKYLESHEWARLEADGTVTVGITDHAQEELGDVVYVEHTVATVLLEALQVIRIGVTGSVNPLL